MFHAETGGRNGVAGTRDREDWRSEDVPGPQRGLPEAAPPGGAAGTRGPPSPPRSFPRRPKAPRRTAERPIASAPATTALRVPGIDSGNRANPRKQSIQGNVDGRDAAPAYHPLGFRPLRPPGFKAPPTCPPARVDERGKVPSAVALNLGPPGMRIVRYPSDARMRRSMRLGPIQQPQTPI